MKNSNTDPDQPLENQTDSPQEAVQQAGNDRVMNQLDIESMIQRYLGDIETLRGKIKEHNSMYNDLFGNDKEYEEHMKKVKDATKLRSGVKQRIMQQPAVKELGDKLKTLRDEMKDLEDALSGYVQQYQKLTNTNQITLPNGDMMQIILVPKLQKIRTDR